MSKVKGFCRRFMACLMVCFMLSFTVAGDYLGVQSMKVYATGVTEVMILKALVEAIMASMGLSFSSTADLNNAASGLSSSMSAYEDYSYGTASPFKELKEQVSSCLTLGMLPSLCFTQTTYQFLQNYCYNLASDQVSSASDVVSPFVGESGIDTERVKFTESTISEILYNKNIYSSDGIALTLNNEELLAAPIIVTFLTPNNASGSATLHIRYFRAVDNVILVFRASDTLRDDYRYKPEAYPHSYYAYNKNGEYGSVRNYPKVFNYYLNYNYTDEFYLPDTSKNPIASNNQLTSRSYYQNSYISTWYNDYYSIPIPDADHLGSQVMKIYINEGTEIYSSWEEYNILKYSAMYRPASKVYGTSSTAKTPTVDESGSISLELADPTITACVEQAINTAIAANPSITEEELNAVASDVIAAQNGTTDAVNQNTATLSSLLTSILATVRSIAIDVSAISVSGGGSAALDWTDVQGAFDEVEVSGSSDNDSDNDDENDDGKPKVWVPPEMKAVGFLAPLLMLLGGALSNLSSFQSAILGTLEGVEEWIMDIPENIAHALDNTFAPTFEAIGTAVGTIAGNLEEWIMDIPESIMELLSVHDLPLDLLLEGVLSLPLGIADALEDVFAGGISVTIPDFLDYTSLLERIIELLEQFFMIDTAVLSASLVQLELVWEGKLPFGDKLFGLYQQLRFPDTYVYPVIKVQTPDILRNFYSSDYIILLDCEDYKQYFLWARNIVKAWLWFCFGLSIFNHLRADFRIS